MDTALLGVRLLLVTVFLVAGVTKLADQPGSRQAMIDFGLPARLAAPSGLLLPLIELAIAVVLIPVATAWWGAVGALTLLLIFIVVIGITLARGRTPDCHCFGQLHSEPVGWQTLARNGALATAAGFLVWQGHGNPSPSMVRWIGTLTSGQLIGIISTLSLLAVLAVQGWILMNLMRQNGRLLLRMDELEARLNAGGIAPMPAPAQPVAGLPVGSPSPAFELPLVSGGTLTLGALCAKAKPILLIFSDPGCGPCTVLLPDIAHWQRQYTDKLTLALVSRGSSEANRAKSAEFVLLQQDREVAEAYHSHGTPSAVIVNPDGTIGSPLAMGSDAIKTLVVDSTKIPSLLPIAKIGELAPNISLLDLNDNLISLAAIRGRDTLLLFWNPSCGYCNQMLAQLQAWDKNPPKGAPQLLVISVGTVEANQSMDLQSTVVLDQSFSAGRAFGAAGTPSAVLVDSNSKIASEIAVGSPAVLALMRGGSGYLRRSGKLLALK